MSELDREPVYFIGDETSPDDGIWSQPLSLRTQCWLWGILVSVLIVVVLSMRVAWHDGFFWVSLMAIVGSAWCVTKLLHYGWYVAAVLAVFGIHFLMAMSMVLPAVPLVASFFSQLAGVLVVICFFRRSPSRLWPVMFVTLIATMMYTSVIRNQELSRIDMARRENPFVNLQDRLAYESRPVTRTKSPLYRDQNAIELDELDAEWEGNHYWPRRRDKLSKIHGSYVNRFASTPGFGVGRMPTSSPLPLPDFDIRTITLNEGKDQPAWPQSVQGEYRSWRSSSQSPWIYYPLKQERQIAGFDYHFAASKDFLNPETFGYVNQQREVAGFIEHAFHNAPPSLQHDSRVWSLTGLKLVSLLQFDEPQVYQSENLPRMDEISSMTVPTRDLDSFEAGALKQLLDGDETVLVTEGNQMRMLGALRARNQCMECHNVDHGELLGAFTYRFNVENLNETPEQLPSDSTRLTRK